jgi:hypothetical protein
MSPDREEIINALLSAAGEHEKNITAPPRSYPGVYDESARTSYFLKDEVRRGVARSREEIGEAWGTAGPQGVHLKNYSDHQAEQILDQIAKKADRLSQYQRSGLTPEVVRRAKEILGLTPPEEE